MNWRSMPKEISFADVYKRQRMDGIEVCRLIRSKVLCPILFLTARVDEDDKINGLDVYKRQMIKCKVEVKLYER